MTRQIISIVMPPEHTDAEEYAKKLGVDLWNSHTLKHLQNLLNQVRSHLTENKPVSAFIALQMVEKELETRINEGAKR